MANFYAVGCGPGIPAGAAVDVGAVGGSCDCRSIRGIRLGGHIGEEPAFTISGWAICWWALEGHDELEREEAAVPEPVPGLGTGIGSSEYRIKPQLSQRKSSSLAS